MATEISLLPALHCRSSIKTLGNFCFDPVENILWCNLMEMLLHARWKLRSVAVWLRLRGPTVAAKRDGRCRTDFVVNIVFSCFEVRFSWWFSYFPGGPGGRAWFFRANFRSFRLFNMVIFRAFRCSAMLLKGSEMSFAWELSYFFSSSTSSMFTFRGNCHTFRWSAIASGPGTFWLSDVNSLVLNVVGIMVQPIRSVKSFQTPMFLVEQP